MTDAVKPEPRHSSKDEDDAAKVEAVPYDEHAQKVIDQNREVLKKEAEGVDELAGPADNLTGDASEKPEDHITSYDVYKKAFPPGPDDPSKAPKQF